MTPLESILSIFAPHECINCHVEGKVLCVFCKNLEIPKLPSRCYKCHKITKDFRVCTSCRHKTKLSHVWVRTDYKKLTSDLIIKYKFERASSAHKIISELMHEVLPILPNNTLLVGVPTSTQRIRERGYDHIKLLVREVSKKSGYIYEVPVIRTGQAHQFGSTRSQRLAQLKDSFIATKHSAIEGKNILLIDDVLTTGATIETIAATLKLYGAKQVNALVFAQKV